jgi:hypothetical protein
VRLEAQIQKLADVSVNVLLHRKRRRWLGVLRQQMGRFHLLNLAMGA